MAKAAKKAKSKKANKYDITVKLSGNPDEGLKSLLTTKKATPKAKK